MASSWKPNSSARTASFSSVGSSMSSQTNESGRFKTSSIWTGSNSASCSRPSTYSLHAMLIVEPRVTHIPRRAWSAASLQQWLDRGLDLRSRHRSLEPGSDNPALVYDDHPGLCLEPPPPESGRGALQGGRRRLQVRAGKELLDVDEVRFALPHRFEGLERFVHHRPAQHALAQERGGEGDDGGPPVRQGLVERDVVQGIGRVPRADLARLR